MARDRVSAAAVVALFGLSACAGGTTADEAAGLGDADGAQYACEQFVEDRLKAPSTAEFSDQSESNDGDVWTATGSVDSENSFGANLRSDYKCVVRYLADEDESYELVEFTGLD